MTHHGSWALGVLAFLGAWALLAWIRFRRGRGEVLFTVLTVGRQPLRERIRAQGELQARTQVPVDASVSAKIKELHVRDGQWVQAGDLLVSLDRERYRQEFNRADQRLRITQRELDHAEATWQHVEQAHWRMERLFQEKLLAIEEFLKIAQERQKAVLERDHCRLAVKQAWTEVALTREALDKTIIRAPVTGCVTDLKAGKGEAVVLMVLSPLEEMLAEVKVQERVALTLKPGQGAEVRVNALPGRVFQGKVLEVSGGRESFRFQTPQAPGEPRERNVRILIPGEAGEAGGLRPGMGIQVVLAREEQGPLALPRQAIVRSAAQREGEEPRFRPVVLVVKDGVVEERPLKLGRSTRKQVEVWEGLQSGEEVLIGPPRALAGLVPGQRVRTRLAPILPLKLPI